MQFWDKSISNWAIWGLVLCSDSKKRKQRKRLFFLYFFVFQILCSNFTIQSAWRKNGVHLFCLFNFQQDAHNSSDSQEINNQLMRVARPKISHFFIYSSLFFQFVENLRTLILCCNVDIISIIESDVNFKLIVDVCAWRTETPFADALYSHLNRHSLHKTHTKKERKRYTPLISCVCTRCAMGRRLSTCQLVLCSEHSMHSMLKFS